MPARVSKVSPVQFITARTDPIQFQDEEEITLVSRHVVHGEIVVEIVPESEIVVLAVYLSLNATVKREPVEILKAGDP
jgi:hypothetical protein